MKHPIMILSGQFNYEEHVPVGCVASGFFLLSGFLAEIYNEDSYLWSGNCWVQVCVVTHTSSLQGGALLL